MRFKGTLTTWHDDRGFGFITPDEGGQDIFVHISQLPRGIKPTVGQALGFEISLNHQGKKKAVGVFLQGPDPLVEVNRIGRAGRGKRPSTLISTLAFSLFLLLCGIVYGTYRHLEGRANASATAGTPLFKCDGRRYCSQMRSCKEAKFFLNNCPGVEMDGDHDGVPCEQDLCTFLNRVLP